MPTIKRAERDFGLVVSRAQGCNSARFEDAGVVFIAENGEAPGSGLRTIAPGIDIVFETRIEVAGI